MREQFQKFGTIYINLVYINKILERETHSSCFTGILGQAYFENGSFKFNNKLGLARVE